MEILIVGAGNSGLPAAVAAVEAGAHVTLIEKTDRVGGTLWRSSATMSAAGTRMQRAKGIDDSPESHFEDAMHFGRSRADSAILWLAVANGGAAIDWLQDHGVPFSDDSPRPAPEHELYSQPRSHDPLRIPGTPAAGRSLIGPLEALVRQFEQAGTLRLVLNAPVVDLIVEDGRVAGVVAVVDGSRQEFGADAVILASGGYASNPAMVARFHGKLGHILSLAMPDSTGDGLRLAEGIGGVLVNMDLLIAVPGGVEDPAAPGRCLYWVTVVRQRYPGDAGDLWINAEGKRFIREDELSPDARERAVMAQTDCQLTAIFDEPMRVGLTEAVGAFTRRELEGGEGNPNVIVSANTIEELAEKIGHDPATVAETVRRYNGYVAAGTDLEFGREKMPKAIDTPPFHAVVTHGTILSTRGGVKVDDHLRVVRDDGTPIPGLYAAGEVIGWGQVMGDASVGGLAAGPAVTFGLLAARFATAEAAVAVP